MRSLETPGIVITRCKGNRATKTKYSPVAQLAEHSTVNRRVTGSSPVGGADIARTPERSSGVLAIYVPLARTSNPSGLRPRRGKDFWFLARSENLRLAGSSPVGGAKLKASERSSEAFPFSRRDSNTVTTALGAGAGAPTPGPRAYALGGITVFYFLARSEKPSPRCVESSATVAYGVVEIFGSSRARKIFASLVRVQSGEPS